LNLAFSENKISQLFDVCCATRSIHAEGQVSEPAAAVRICVSDRAVDAFGATLHGRLFPA
jgi:hypothetical protein